MIMHKQFCMIRAKREEKEMNKKKQKNIILLLTTLLMIVLYMWSMFFLSFPGIFRVMSILGICISFTWLVPFMYVNAGLLWKKIFGKLGNC